MTDASAIRALASLIRSEATYMWRQARELDDVLDGKEADAQVKRAEAVAQAMIHLARDLDAVARR